MDATLISPVGQRDVTLGQADWNRILLVTVYHGGDFDPNMPPLQCAHRDDEPVLSHSL